MGQHCCCRKKRSPGSAMIWCLIAAYWLSSWNGGLSFMALGKCSRGRSPFVNVLRKAAKNDPVQEPTKRQKINPLWVKVKNGAAVEYNRDDFDNFSQLLKEVKQDNPTLLGAADRSRLKLYQTDSDEEALQTWDLLPEDGGKTGAVPLYVDYPDQSAPAETSQVHRAEKFAAALKAQDFEEAHKTLNDMIDEVDGREAQEDKTYVSPVKVDMTWRKKSWGMKLEKTATQVLTEAEARSPRVLTMHAGSGTGKTHALLEAPGAWLDEVKGKESKPTMTSIYVTYNMDQHLEMDRKEGFVEQAICLRVLLRLCGCNNAPCADILQKFKNRVELDKKLLLQLVTKKIQTTHCMIAVDECGALKQEEAVQFIASTLGKIALQLKTQGTSCLVIMAALSAELFTSISERETRSISTDLPNNEAQNLVIDRLLKNRSSERRAMAKAWGGYHFRSLVLACVLLNKFPEIGLLQVMEDTRQRFDDKIQDHEKEALRQYMRSCVSVGMEQAKANHNHAGPYLAGGAVPPALAAFLYDSQDACAKFQHPVQQMFACSAFTDVTKQLELCGVEFDRFRALHALPVVPRDMVVHNVGDEGIEWYRDLVFPESVARRVADESFFCMGSTAGAKEQAKKKRPTVKRTRKLPQLGTYYHPGDTNHPWVDRVVVARRQSDESRCLVLYQDKINNNLPDAVKGLNEAADAFQAEGWFDDHWKLLCVAHVVDASASTRTQNKFRHPYILVRSSELNAFYTPTLAPAIHFLKERHGVE